MIGQRFGSYEILARLGEGGMGEVYRARDARLDREVAIKVLSKEFANDPAALARFEREALSVAKLSHPNILSIFEFGQQDDTAFVVTELVDGETLRARLDGGALTARRAVGYALQIAKGIAAAHARGIVHRDLKPENVMITRDDHVKVLDFGLAKSVDSNANDMTRAGVATSAGVILGTFGYMAPEQVRGLAVDHRADIFAFGAVLYEMLSGRRAFKGETAADTMTAILAKDPEDLDTARLAISPALERIVRRCLEKSPDLRFQSANDLAFALDTLSTGSTPALSSTSAIEAPLVAANGGRFQWLPWTIAAVAVIAAGSAWLLRPGPAAPERRWDSFTRISEAAGEETSPSLSPDGTTVIYSMRVNGSWDIFSQRVGGRNATQIISDPQRDENGAAFSPDGSLIAFHVSDSPGGIFVAGATGESVRRVTDRGFDPAWSPDGKQIAFATEEVNNPASRAGLSAVYVVDAAGGSPRKVADEDAVQPSWSPSGERIVYWSNTGGQRDLYTVAASGGARVPVIEDPALDWSPVWSPDGRFIYFASDRGGDMNLWRIAVEQSSGRVLGAPEAVTAGVQASAALPRFSKDGSRLAFRSRVGSINPVAIPFDAEKLRAGIPVTLDTRNNIRIASALSRDGRQVGYFSTGERQEDLFVGPPDGPMRRVTDDESRDRGPTFTPDGRSLVFYSNRGGQWGVWGIGVDGGNLHKISVPPDGAGYPVLSPSGDVVVFPGSTSRPARSVPVAGDPAAPPKELPGSVLGDTYFNPTGWSADGSRLTGYFLSDAGRYVGIGIYDLAAKTTTLISPDATPWVRWLADNRRIIYFTRNGSQLVVLDTVTRARTVIDVRLPGPAADDVFAMSPDNRTIYYGAARSEADIWIVERR